MTAATVVMGTRNRADQARRALESLHAALPSGCDVVVVDQSDDDETAMGVEELAREGFPVTLIRSSRRGLSAARNDGCGAARGELVLFTDDDCIVKPGWARAWCDAFAANPRMGIGFGVVTAPPYDPSSGHTPTFDPGPVTHVHDARIFRGGVVAVGMGANMAMRRDVVDATCGFDEQLGAGRRYAGAEETDMAYRVARRGWLIGHVAGPEVVHHGFRPRSEASALSQAYGLGTGAMYAKHIRAGDVYATEIALREMLMLAGKVVRQGVRGRRPLGVRALRAYVLGLTTSVRLPVDARRRLYDASTPASA